MKKKKTYYGFKFLVMLLNRLKSGCASRKDIKLMATACLTGIAMLRSKTKIKPVCQKCDRYTDKYYRLKQARRQKL